MEDVIFLSICGVIVALSVYINKKDLEVGMD